jgi:hypothetical protein
MLIQRRDELNAGAVNLDVGGGPQDTNSSLRVDSFQPVDQDGQRPTSPAPSGMGRSRPSNGWRCPD